MSESPDKDSTISWILDMQYQKKDVVKSIVSQCCGDQRRCEIVAAGILEHIKTEPRADESSRAIRKFLIKDYPVREGMNDESQA